MKSNLKLFFIALYNSLKGLKKKIRIKDAILILLIPLSNAKALFYYSDEKVSWYIFSSNIRPLCNVVEDYSNIVIMSVIFYYLAFVRIDLKLRNICIYLFVLNILDLFHLGLMDLEGFLYFKIALAFIILKVCNRLRIF